MIYVFWLPVWYLLVIMLFVLWFTYSGYPFGFFWSLCCLSFDLSILITPLVSFGHYVVCPLIYVFWLPLWYLLVIMLFVLWFRYSGYPFGIFWSLGHYVVCPLIYVFWIPLWYLLVIILFVLWFTASDYLFGICWSLCCLSFDLGIMITSLVSFGHYVVCRLIYVFWLPLWFLLVIMLFVLWFTYSDYLFGFFWSLCSLSFNLQLLVTSLVSVGHYVVCPLIYSFWLPLWYLLVIILFVLWFTYSDYLFGFFWSLCCLSFNLQLLITSLVSFGHYSCLSFDLQILITSLVSFGHYVVCPLIYRFWLPLWYLLVIMLFVLRFTYSDYLFGIFWSLCCLSFNLQLLITSLVSFGHYVVCPLIYSFWLPLWYLLVIMLFVLWFTDSDYLFGIFWSLYCLSFDLRILITCLVSFGHYVVCPLIYRFWLPLWYLLVIMLFVLRFTYSDYLFGIFWSLCCLSFNLQLLITSLVSFGHYVVCPLIYSFWLPLWYLLVIILFVLWFTYSDYLFGIFWSLCCLSFNLQLLITSLGSVGHYIVCPSIYVFWLPLWYLLVIMLFVL